MAMRARHSVPRSLALTLIFTFWGRR